MVCFQRLPALAILLNLLSPSTDFLSSGGMSAILELNASITECGGPEKNDTIL